MNCALAGKMFMKKLTGDFSQRLRMPERLTSHFSEGIPEALYLRGLAGLKWEIGLTKTDDGVFLMKSWNAFVDAHNLKKGDVCIFVHIGGYVFDVLMFDAADEFAKDEVDYIKVFSEEDTDDVNEECDLDPEPVSGSGGANAPAAEGTSQSRKEKKKKKKNKKRKHSSSEPPISDVGRKNPMDLARAFKVANKLKGPSFIKLMTCYTVEASFLTVPTDFARKNLPPNDANMFLRVPESDYEWEIKYHISNNRKIIRFGSNWRSFTIDNTLKKGDVCVFVLSNKKPLILTAQIFRQ